MSDPKFKTFCIDTNTEEMHLFYAGNDRTSAILCAEDINEREREGDMDYVLDTVEGVTDELLEESCPPRKEFIGITFDIEKGRLVYWEDHSDGRFGPESEIENRK